MQKQTEIESVCFSLKKSRKVKNGVEKKFELWYNFYSLIFWLDSCERDGEENGKDRI